MATFDPQWGSVKTLVNVAAALTPNTITVPAGEGWDVYCMAVDLVSNATAGNRLLVVTFKDATGAVLFEIASGVAQVASTTIKYFPTIGAQRETAVNSGRLIMPLPSTFTLPPGTTITFSDATAVAAGADTYACRILGDRVSLG